MGYKDIESKEEVCKDKKIDLENVTIYASYEVDNKGKIIFSADD